MTMLEKLKENDFDLETFDEFADLAFRDLVDKDGKVDVADVGKEIFTDDVKTELSAEVDELFEDMDIESAEGVADMISTGIKVVVNKICDTWLRSKFIEVLETEVE